MLLVPLLTSPLEDVSLELVELLEDVVPALLLDVVPSVEAVLEPAVATRAPAPASEVSTAPPAMTARTRPTRRVLRVRATARSSAVGSAGTGVGRCPSKGDWVLMAMASSGAGGGEGVQACGGDGSGAAGPALGRTAAARSGELAVRRRRAGLGLLLGLLLGLVLGPAFGLVLLARTIVLLVVLEGGSGDRPGLVVVAAGVGGLGGDADGDRGADGTERAGSDHSAAGGGRAPHLPVAVEGAA